MKKLLGISYFSYICLFWVRDPNLLTESAGTVLPVSLSSVSSFSWLLKICLSHWNLSRYFSHIRGVLASGNTESFPNSWVTLRHFSQRTNKKSNQHGSQNPLTKTKSPREGKVPDLKWISCPLIFLTSFTLSLQQIRDPESTLFPHSHKHPPPQISLAATKALAEIIHTNLKTRTVSEILLTQEPWGRIQTAVAGSRGLDESLLQIPNW